MAGIVLWGCLFDHGLVVQSACHQSQCPGLHGMLGPWFVLLLLFSAGTKCIIPGQFSRARAVGWPLATQ